MTAKTLELISMVESLPVDIKTILVDKLLASMQPSQKEIDALWATEVEKRLGELDRGEVDLIPGEKVFDEIRDRFRR